MKKLQSNFTTPKQSKRLLELGVPEWTADCYYYDFFDKHPKVSYIDADREYKWNLESEYAPKPCWSVGRLIEIFCICTDDRWSIEYLNGMPQTIIEKTIEAITGNKVDFSKLEE